MIDFWIREVDKRTFDDVYRTDARPYPQACLTGEIDDPGYLSNIMDNFTLARWRLWVPEDTKQEFDFAHVKNVTLYPQGVVFTPFTANYIELDHRSQLIHRKERIELFGNDTDDFPSRFFPTYEKMLSKQQVKDHRPFLYRCGVDSFIVDVPGKFRIEDVDGMLRKGGVLLDAGVSGSKYMGIHSVSDRKLVFTNWAHHIDESAQKLPEYIASLAERGNG